MTTPTPDEIAHTIATHLVMASVLIGSDGKVQAKQTGPGELELHLPGHTYKVTIT